MPYTPTPAEILAKHFCTIESLPETRRTANLLKLIDNLVPLPIEVIDAILDGWRRMLTDNNWEDIAYLIPFFETKKYTAKRKAEEEKKKTEEDALVALLSTKIEQFGISTQAANSLFVRGFDYVYQLCEKDHHGSSFEGEITDALNDKGLAPGMIIPDNLRARLPQS